MRTIADLADFTEHTGIIELVTRDEWGAEPPLFADSIDLPTPRLWVHHSGDDRQGASAVRGHQRFHIDERGWFDIAYSFLVGDRGEVYVGRGPGVAGAHTRGDNYHSHAICLLGNFEGHPPSGPAVDALVALARYGSDAGWWVPTLGGHLDAPGAATECPGDYLYALLPEIRALADEEHLDMDHATFKRLSREATWEAMRQALDDPDSEISIALDERVRASLNRAWSWAGTEPDTSEYYPPPFIDAVHRAALVAAKNAARGLLLDGSADPDPIQ